MFFRNIASFVKVDVFQCIYFLLSSSEHTFKCKSTQKQAKRRLHHHPPRKFRHLVEKREEIFALSREEEKAV